jgi:CRP-like cAMP-binding protein
MTDQFFNYTEKFVSFSVRDKELLTASLSFRKAEAKTELVSYQEKTDELFFLVKGCVRKYFVKDGEPITIYIALENSFIGAFDSLVTGSKSKQVVECLEYCEMLVLKKADLEMLYLKVPLMNEFMRKVLEQALIQFNEIISMFMLNNPAERYLEHLSQNPEILQRVPQHMLATYLGITATSLSRIRKRIFEKA